LNTSERGGRLKDREIFGGYMCLTFTLGMIISNKGTGVNSVRSNTSIKVGKTHGSCDDSLGGEKNKKEVLAWGKKARNSYLLNGRRSDPQKEGTVHKAEKQPFHLRQRERNHGGDKTCARPFRKRGLRRNISRGNWREYWEK